MLASQRRVLTRAYMEGYLSHTKQECANGAISMEHGAKMCYLL